MSSTRGPGEAPTPCRPGLTHIQQLDAAIAVETSLDAAKVVWQRLLGGCSLNLPKQQVNKEFVSERSESDGGARQDLRRGESRLSTGLLELICELAAGETRSEFYCFG